MPRNPTNPRTSSTLDEKLKRKRDNLANDIETSPENLQLVNKFIDGMIRDGKSRQTCLTYLTSLRYILKNTDIEFQHPTIEDIESMLITLETWNATSGPNKGEPLSPYTKNTIKMQTKAFLQFLGCNDEANVIKCKNLKGKKIPEDIITKDEVLEIVDHAGSLRDKALLGVLYETGCRSGEILSLKIKNVDFLHNGGCAVTFPQGKTGPRRVIIFNFTPYLRQWIDAHPLKDTPDAPLWPTGDYRAGPLSDVGLRYLLRETVKRTGIKKRVYVHGFRHARATHLAEHLTEQQMKAYLGWTPGSDMASVYVHLSGKDIDKAIMAMNGIEDIESPVDTMRPGTCARCHELTPPNAKYCFKCGLPLTYEANQTDKEIFETLIEKVKQNPELIVKALEQA
ncbi:site-specific integrase [Methanolobus profundi]|uniref:Site-specific recombinase XerD n=1 Tax=Methanolobus profundi TaxID=487685 RepID=A0A1I4RCD1_9EURY|nr:site-specific integrase [Methanolobus profundi]SFM49553.1 Site-specific recombinase XerD [Methanolobus profundi]